MRVKGQPAPVAGSEDAPFSILADDGSIRPGVVAPEVPDTAALTLYRRMLQVRLVDDRMLKLQRQGRLGFYMASTGEEATHFGGAYALQAADWIFPSYREPGVFFWRGYTIEQYVNQLFGNAADPIKGRQMPVHHSAAWLNIVSISSPIGTQIPQATGMAMGARIQGKDDVALVYFGEGASATGQFHVGLNFAGVFKAPVIFFCRNAGGATPGGVQTAAKTIAVKAHAYGLPGIRVDGNDLLAVIAVVQDAAARARAGKGATLIEAVTSRVPATDETSSRGAVDPAEWSDRDPLERWRRHLEQRGLWTPSLHERLLGELDEELGRAIESAGALGAPDVATLFDDVFAELPPHLQEQKAELLAAPRAKPGHGGH